MVCGFFLAGLMVPAIFTFLPNFVLIKRLGLVDTLLGIALPGMPIGSPGMDGWSRGYYKPWAAEPEVPNAIWRLARKNIRWTDFGGPAPWWLPRHVSGRSERAPTAPTCRTLPQPAPT